MSATSKRPGAERFVVWLEARFQELAKREALTEDRPLSPEAEERLEARLAELDLAARVRLEIEELPLGERVARLPLPARTYLTRWAHERVAAVGVSVRAAMAAERTLSDEAFEEQTRRATDSAFDELEAELRERVERVERGR